MLYNYKLEKEKITCLCLWIYRVNLQIRTPPFGTFLSSRMGLVYENQVGWKKCLERNYFLVAKSESIDFFSSWLID